MSLTTVQDTYLHDFVQWLAFEMDDCADGIGPVPDLAERSLRALVVKANAVARGEYPDCRPFGPHLGGVDA